MAKRKAKYVRVTDLPWSTMDTGVMLYCPNCTQTYSATRGDYFMVPRDEALTCACGDLLQLVRKHTTYVPV